MDLTLIYLTLHQVNTYIRTNIIKRENKTK
nr:MAG TPA: hypothetical protein [Caudoviricetes sp.]